jgi:hypothetical protein
MKQDSEIKMIARSFICEHKARRLELATGLMVHGWKMPANDQEDRKVRSNYQKLLRIYLDQFGCDQSGKKDFKREVERLLNEKPNV